MERSWFGVAGSWFLVDGWLHCWPSNQGWKCPIFQTKGGYLGWGAESARRRPVVLRRQRVQGEGFFRVTPQIKFDERLAVRHT